MLIKGVGTKMKTLEILKNQLKRLQEQRDILIEVSQLNGFAPHNHIGVLELGEKIADLQEFMRTRTKK